MRKYRVGHLLDIVGATREEAAKFDVVEADNEIDAVIESMLVNIKREYREECRRQWRIWKEGKDLQFVKDKLCGTIGHVVVSVEEV